MVNFRGQEVKRQGHVRPKTNLNASRGGISIDHVELTSFLAERYYVTFGLLHELSVCRL